jgi:deoxyribodipyrimidine photo-lyase
MKTLGLHWFRRDLRIAGNLGLRAQQERHSGRVLGIFAFDKSFLSRPDFSPNRFQVFLKTLDALRSELRAAGGDLLVMDVGPDDAFKTISRLIPKNTQVTISWSRDYEPFARVRDERVKALCESFGWDVVTERDHLLFEPHEILSGQGTPYKVYTPFAKRWFELLKTDEGQERIARQRAGLTYLDLRNKGKAAKLFQLTWSEFLGHQCPKDHLDHYLKSNHELTTVPIPQAGSLVAWSKLVGFSGKLGFYGDTRDFMAKDGTSGLAMFLKNGSITVPQIIAAYELEYLKFSGDDGATKFLKELIWREFYYHVMWHFPHCETRSFKEDYKDIAWENDESFFDAWKEGLTGYPIVDAAMRQLKSTGMMHNRARMIVASFLTKDLHIDWRWGERWFMNQLLDGDLAPNNGGWQWAASTGCDAQPYFRIFNPTRQSERFDPEGSYIRTFIPELRDVDTGEIHDPKPQTRKKHGYPAPIVEHKPRAIKAQMMFKK